MFPIFASLKARPSWEQDFYLRFLLFLFCFLIFLFPIIHANFYYNDDIFHAQHPINVLKDGRPLQQLFLWIISSFATTDAAPLFQICGTAAAAIGAAFAAIALDYSILTGFLALSFLFCNEFFLENLSYRFDSAGMGLALGLSLFAFFVPIALKKKKPVYQWLGTSLVLFLAFNAYQASVNVYGGLSCLAAIMAVFSGKAISNTWKTLLYRASAFSSALILSRIFTTFIPALHSAYTMSHSKIILFDYAHLWENYKSFFSFFLLLLSPWNSGGLSNHGAFYIIFLVSGSIAFILQLFRLKNPLQIISVLFFLAGIFLFFSGPMILLEKPAFIPRVMSGEAVMLTASVTFLLGYFKGKSCLKTFFVWVTAYVLYGSIVASFAYGNASHLLEKYKTTIDTEMVQDLTSYTFTPEFKYYMENNVPMSFVILGNKKRFMPEQIFYAEHKYPVFQKILMQPPTWETTFTSMGFDGNRFNLLAASKSKTNLLQDFSFITPEEEMNPAGAFFRAELEERVKKCAIDDIKYHSIFFTYRIGSVIVFDYDQRCKGRGEKFITPRPKGFPKKNKNLRYPAYMGDFNPPAALPSANLQKPDSKITGESAS